MQVKDLIVTGDAKILGNLYTKDGSVGAGGGGGSGEGGSGITYRLTKSGSTITLTGSDGSSSSVTDSDTTTSVDLSGYVPTSRTVNGKALTGNISLSASDVGAAASSHTHDDRYFTESEINSKLSGYSPTSHTHNDLKPFVATYGSTTFSDILAAHNAGRMVILTKMDLSGYFGVSSSASVTVVGRVTSDEATFHYMWLLTNGSVVYSVNTIASNNTWTSSSLCTPSLNRTTHLNASDTNYTTLMARGTSLNSSTTNPAVNGAIAWTYA